MLDTTLKFSQKFFDLYSAYQDKAAAVQIIREVLHRELRLNAELAKEARELPSQEREGQLVPALLNSMQTSGFDALSSSGIPLTKVFPERWSLQETEKVTYAQHLKKIHCVSDLVERAYHRTRVQKIRYQVGQSKNQQAVNYLAVLLHEAAKATGHSNF